MAFANPNKPAGLSPLRYLNSAKYDGKVNTYAIAAAVTTPFYPGDLVSLAAGGNAPGLPNIALTAAGTNPAVGVVVAVGLQPFGPFVNVNNLSITSRPTGAQPQVYYAAVSDDPNIIYEIQEGGAGANLTFTTALTKNAQILYALPATGVVVSGTTLDNTTGFNAATANLKILRFVQRPDNQLVTAPTTGGGAQKWEVIINNHVFRGTGTAGV